MKRKHIILLASFIVLALIVLFCVRHNSGTITFATLRSYQPLSNGRTWTYHSSALDGTSNIVIETCSGPVILQGKTCYAMTVDNNGNDRSITYENWSESGFAEYGSGDISDAEIYSQPAILIPTKIKAGTEWSQSITTFGRSREIQGKILGFQTLTVAAGTFHNVLAIQIQPISTESSSHSNMWKKIKDKLTNGSHSPTSFISQNNTIIWFAPGVGKVKEDIAYDTIIGRAHLISELQKYTK